MKLLFDNFSRVKKNPNLLIWSAAALLFFLSFFLRLTSLQQTNFANGWDAYFYLIQIKSWVEEGAMHSSDSSLIYPFLRVTCWLSGDYVLGLKLASAFLSSLFVIFVFIFGKKQMSLASAFLLATYFLWSPHLTWFSAQYPKNLLGINLLILFFISFEIRFWWISALLLVANYFGHRMTFILSGIYFFIYFAGKMIPRFLRFLSSTISIFGVLIFFVSTVLFFLFLAPQFSGTLSFFDLERIGEALAQQPHFSPLSFYHEYNDNHRLSFFWKMEIGLSVIFYLVGVVLFFFKKIKLEPLAFFVLCSLLIFPFLEWSLTSMSFRFVLIFVLLTPIFVLSQRVTLSNSLTLIASILLSFSSFFSWKSYQPKIHDAPYEKYAKVTQKTFDFLKNKNPELVIAHNALAEFFTFTTGN